MAESTKKKTKDKKSEGKKVAAPILEQLVLDRKIGKYQVVDRISFWAKELRKREEHRHLTQTEILELAMTEVLAGKVDEAELDKKLIAAAIANGTKKESAASKKKS